MAEEKQSTDEKASPLCLVIGPPGAGKRTLMQALARPDTLESRSDPTRRAVIRSDGDMWFLRVEKLKAVNATATLGHESKLEHIDIGHALAAERTCSAATIALCIGLDGVGPSRNALLGYLRSPELIESKSDLCICLTKYDRKFEESTPEAFADASRPVVAQDAARSAFAPGGDYEFIRAEIAALAGGRGRKVWVQPLSSFGFIAGHGGANRMPSRDCGEDAPRRTRWAAREFGHMDQDLRDEPAWRPFLTQQPFITLDRGRAGAVTFKWSDIAGMRADDAL